MSTDFEDLILRDITVNRPAAGIPGRLFYDTTLEKWERDTGAAWEDCEPSAGAGDVIGPATSVDHSVSRFNGTDNKTIQDSLATIDDSGSVNIPAGQTYKIDGTAHSHGASSANHAFYTYLASLLEPLAIEAIQTGTYSYVIAAGATKLALNVFWAKIASTGRFDVRNPLFPVPLRGVTVTGLDASSTGVFIDPTLATYTDARTTYLDRLQTIYETAPLCIPLVAPSTYYELLPGPYGSIMTSLTNHDFTWLVVRPYGTSLGWNLMDEIGDTGASDYQRVAHGLYMPFSKYVVATLLTGAEKAGGAGIGSITYFNCPSSWGKVTDATSYDFRDDFMGASLDTATKWTRAESSAGNVEIQTTAGLANWCKLTGTITWGQNGAYSQTGIARANGKIFLCDIYTNTNATANNSHLVGFSDGGGQSYTNFSHGVLFTSTGVANQIKVYENGNDRGAVGAGYVDKTIYRIKITASLTGNNAAYAIQGGAYGALGSGTWTDITPAGTSSATSPIYAGMSCGGTGTMYIGDVKIY